MTWDMENPDQDGPKTRTAAIAAVQE